jgi:hypothetical protein
MGITGGAGAWVLWGSTMASIGGGTAATNSRRLEIEHGLLGMARLTVERR